MTRRQRRVRHPELVASRLDSHPPVRSPPLPANNPRSPVNITPNVQLFPNPRCPSRPSSDTRASRSDSPCLRFSPLLFPSNHQYRRTMSTLTSSLHWDHDLNEPYLLLISPRFPPNHHVRLTPVRSTDADGLVNLFNEPDVGGRLRSTPYPCVFSLRASKPVTGEAKEQR